MKKRLISLLLILLLLPMLTATPLGTFAANTDEDEPDWFTESEALRLYEMNRPSNPYVNMTAGNVTLSDGTVVPFDTAVGVSTNEEFESAVTATTGDRRYVYLLEDIDKTKIIFDMEVVDDVIIDLADVTTLLNALSGNASAMRTGAGDLDFSGAIDIADVTALLNYLSH